MSQGPLIYEGKAKKIYSWSESSEQVFVEYKDSLTAFNALKKGEFAGKGAINRNLTTLIFNYLGRRGVAHHWIKNVGERSMVCRKVSIIPLEVVVRNRLAGSTAKKFNRPEGTEMAGPLVEFYFKSDDLGDPFISDDQALFLECVKTRAELDELRVEALKINSALIHLFSEVGLELIDFKIEFGRALDGQLLLADEISPDCARLWDMKTGEKMDKDRFRRDLGKVDESYKEVWNRLESRWGKEI